MSGEDSSEVVSLERVVFRISQHRCKQDLQPPLLLVVLRRRAHFALVVVPEDLLMVPEAEAPSGTLASPVVAAV